MSDQAPLRGASVTMPAATLLDDEDVEKLEAVKAKKAKKKKPVYDEES